MNLLSQTTKMPCKSISLSAKLCNTGSKLAKIPGTVCSECYALRGFYNMPSVKKNMDNRLLFMSGNDFVSTMISLLRNEEHFRWFDSGDIQNEIMGHCIIDVAEQTQWVEHWIPTKEYKWWRNILSTRILPRNVCLRASTPMDNTKPIPNWNQTSTTFTSKDSAAYTGVECKAHLNKEYKCEECRACWDNNITNIAYPKRPKKGKSNGK
jgi:hypothetical protein